MGMARVGTTKFRGTRPPATLDEQGRIPLRMTFAKQARGFCGSEWDSRALGGSVQGHRLPLRAVGLELRYLLLVGEGDADVVESLEQPPARVVVDVEALLDRLGPLPGLDRPALQID